MKGQMLGVLLVALVWGGRAMLAVTAAADTLEEALVHAYWTHPQLEAQRARSRSSDETLRKALANWYPSIGLTGEMACGFSRANGAHQYTSHAVQLTLTQPLYRGGRTVAQVKQVEAQIRSEQQQLVHTEQTMLLAAAIAYLNLWRDEEILSLNIKNEEVLQRQLRATRERLAVGEITRTDVAQVEARLARATATRKQSVSVVKIAQAVYTQMIGKGADRLVFPTAPVLSLPATREEAISLARSNGPLVGVAAHSADAAVAGIRLAQGELWPTLSMKANVSRTWRKDPFSFQTKTVESTLVLSIPLYQQGLVDSRLRAAKHNASKHVYEMQAARRQAVASAVQAWEALRASIAQIHANTIRMASVETAMQGVQREAHVGSRTVLDVLNTEQERLDAHVELAKLKRDKDVAIFQLLTAVGRMTIQDMIGLPVPPYAPEGRYQGVRGKWFGSTSAS
ncbi:Type I secretion outer membrane protein, TolC precursor [invertebrate metagenome]|uniref:Type I secretion outer membrane protein, TolC n=1 Tax=invertebrate metagenome TaxID=1711999 RepID=A0A484H6M4_9ZZZZ